MEVKAIDTTLLDNIIAHLADPDNPEELARKTVTHAVAFSFYPTKNLGAIGDGGALLPANADMDDTARSIRNYGQTERYIHEVIGLNSRLDELHAATLRMAFLPRLDTWLDRRRAIAAAYLAGLDTPHGG